MFTLFCAILCGLPLAAAQQQPVFGLTHNDTGVQNVPSSAWESAFQSPNATGTASIPGRDIRARFPGSASADWNYTILVRDDVPLGQPTSPSSKSGFFTGIWLRMSVPEMLLSPGESWVPPVSGLDNRSFVAGETGSWEVCRLVFGGDLLRSDGGCEGVFGGSFSGDSPTLEGSNAYDFVRLGSAYDVHQPGNTTAYRDALRRVFLVVHIWGGRDRSVRPQTEVVCLQAREVTAGEDGGSGGQGGGSGGQGGGNQGGDGNGGQPGSQNAGLSWKPRVDALVGFAVVAMVAVL
ncbi:hypothetical protein QBC47DRAFT_447414 [Echria macrotheca]|uniref:Uncharacterized protein n=1 Tax=Echria macrotheca TaxID=438768 RepID=A0AAJ0F5E7_9PEZI|nr:hypothetical protein QBC47DRAFT_447414 [Echria macrotheca]